MVTASGEQNLPTNPYRLRIEVYTDNALGS